MKKSKYFRALMPAAAAAVAAAAVFMYISQNSKNPPGGTIEPGNKGHDEQVHLSEPAPGWWESRRHIYFDIPARIRFHLPGAKRDAAEEITQSAWEEFERIGKIFNPSDPDSETCRLNAADSTKPVAVSAEIFAVLKLSRRLWIASGGAFDPTTTPVKQLWQNAVRIQKPPSERDIKRVLADTGLGHVRLLPERRAVYCEKKGIKFDFGGIAKGLAVDRVVSLLKNAGITNGMVQLGGEIATFGINHDNRQWRIGIQHPEDMDEIWGTISSRNALGVSTSGNYRQPLRIRGHEFYHIFSPETGRPVSEKVLGVTTAGLKEGVSCALLDGAATAITVMGSEKGLDFAERIGIQAVVLTRGPEGRIRENFTPGLADSYERTKKPDP